VGYANKEDLMSAADSACRSRTSISAGLTAIAGLLAAFTVQAQQPADKPAAAPAASAPASTQKPPVAPAPAAPAPTQK